VRFLTVLHSLCAEPIFNFESRVIVTQLWKELLPIQVLHVEFVCLEGLCACSPEASLLATGLTELLWVSH